jgi:hypothetical protein
MLRTWLLIALCGCRGGADDCSRAVAHVMHLAMADTASGDERAVIDTIITATVAQCRTEGLSHEQAECILAAHVPDWDDQLRACPAFAAKPATWVILRPPPAGSDASHGPQ